MNRHTLNWVLLVLAFLGIADSAYLGISETTGASLTCSINGLDGCNTVAQSVYSHVLGVPVGIIGLVFYVLLFVCAAFLIFNPLRFVYRALYLLGWIGLLASVVFVLIQFFIIKALCIYCLGSAAISLLACLTTIQLWVRHAPSRSSVTSEGVGSTV